MNNRAVVFDTQDDVSKAVIDFVNSGIDIEKGIYAGIKVLDKTSDKTFFGGRMAQACWRRRS